MQGRTMSMKNFLGWKKAICGGLQGGIFPIKGKNSLQHNCSPPNKNQQNDKQGQDTTQEKCVHCMVAAQGPLVIFQTNNN